MESDWAPTMDTLVLCGPSMSSGTQLYLSLGQLIRVCGKLRFTCFASLFTLSYNREKSFLSPLPSFNFTFLPRIWDIETGTSLSNLEMKTSVRGVNFSYSGTMIAYTTDKMMGHNSELNIIDVRDPKDVDRK